MGREMHLVKMQGFKFLPKKKKNNPKHKKRKNFINGSKFHSGTANKLAEVMKNRAFGFHSTDA